MTTSLRHNKHDGAGKKGGSMMGNNKILRGVPATPVPG